MKGHKKIIADIDIRFKDIDLMGHVNNAVFFTYFEEGRKALYESLFNSAELNDFSFILAHISCDFLRPIKLNDSVIVQLWISETGKKRFGIKYILADKKNKSIVYAKGYSVQVFYDYKKNMTVPVAQGFIEKISEYIEHQGKVR
ncbi:MAG: acyl-CoA thioesterase [Deltaproteobacteria bacterium]|nr:acyl-CoA thioesterase [Deltaproteobacteria bacterium]